MEIVQFEDKNLAHFSYCVLSYGEVAVIDPGRDPQPYYDFTREHNAKIVAVIETHPHADFVSSHLEIHESTGATIYTSKLLGAEYPHMGMEDGDKIALGINFLKVLFTPGHSPDSISILAYDKANEKAVFTGDCLFIGDCGRPDLREQVGAITAERKKLAQQMYHTLREKFLPLNDDVLVYPAHGAGSLCGKALSAQNVSTIRAEKITNWSLQEISEEKFVEELLADQPFIPKYFGFDVALNKKGAPAYYESISTVEKQLNIEHLENDVLIVDVRPREKFREGHLRPAISLALEKKFETWLGSLVSPGEPFYILAGDAEQLSDAIRRSAKIGYEAQIKTAFILETGNVQTKLLEGGKLRGHEKDYTIIDLRNDSELKDGKIFSRAIHIPLHQLRERVSEIPANKSIVVHCAGGYRSSVGTSIIQSAFPKVEVFDLGAEVKAFMPENSNKLHA